MTFKYRVLLAVMLTMIVIGYQVAIAQTKTVKKDFTIMNEASCACDLVIVPTLKNPSACNVSDGSVTLAVSGAQGALTYQWSDPTGVVVSTSKDLLNVSVGYYFLKVTDSNTPSCGTYFSNYTLTSTFDVTATVKDNVGCVTANGAISINPVGGSGNYTYSWRYPDGSETTTKNITGGKVGAYYLTLTDVSTGCRLSRYFNIKSTAQLSVSTTSTTPNTSCLTTTGGAIITVGGGSGQYNYSWYNMQTYAVFATTKDLAAAPGGSYTAIVLDKVSGCLKYEPVTVADETVKPAFTIKDIKPNTNCKGPFNGAVELQISGTPGPYEVSWKGENGIVSTEVSPTNLPTGRYGFTITDSGTKCKTVVSAQSLDAIEISDESLPHINLNINTIKANTSCSASNAEIALTIEDPTTPYTIAWSGPNGFASSEEDINKLAPGNYQLTVEAGCNNPPVIEETTILQEKMKVSLPLTSVVSDPDDNLDLHSFSIVESPGSNAKALITADQILTIDYSSTRFKGTDQLTIKACDVLNACTENSINIEVVGQEGVVVFNAVAPNSTGDNKFMRIDNLPEKNRVSIFNRWGDVVFEVDQYDHQNPEKRFAGFTMAGKALPTGTYLYKIEMEGSEVVTGYLSLKQ